ncbi:hypothetical protein [Aphanothece sacrum]|uniref:Phenylacetate--CoA ligase n=1 Tax=Aphanothece sacrum FPU1 TaxID=1920663 RepID=A0A401IEU0_APHSA|nr:hypothetical protein [Aphanothece sacrum]GBF79751.1 phenylacetate--CoA ligase [Aphanothece sacrum FPU1]GBF87017.1 phenylacetate--CoA ligase [Aphanothece sacrum FPU3]
MLINPTTLRQLWSTIEQTQAHLLLSLDQSELIDDLLCRLQRYKPLSPEECQGLAIYIEQRTTLIRELAESRLEGKFA